MPRGRRAVNWEEVKRDFLFSDDSLQKVGKKHHLTNPHIYRHAKNGKWREQREEFQKKITKKISKEVVNGNVERWKDQVKLWKAVEYQAAKILNKYGGKNKSAIKSSHLVNLATAINISLKSQKLIHGEPTEHITEESHYKSIVWLLEKKRREREGIVDAETVGPEFTGGQQIRGDIRQQTLENPKPLQDQG